jgi:hypothetical protein
MENLRHTQETPAYFEEMDSWLANAPPLRPLSSLASPPPQARSAGSRRAPAGRSLYLAVKGCPSLSLAQLKRTSFLLPKRTLKRGPQPGPRRAQPLECLIFGPFRKQPLVRRLL